LNLAGDRTEIPIHEYEFQNSQIHKFLSMSIQYSLK
jgi:hypothetical protein